MKGRIPANSESLKENFPHIYKEFFTKCPIVVSAPGSFWWTGEYATENGGLAIIQKIPLRTYVGIEPASPGICKFGTYTFYLPSKKKFVPALFEEPISTKLLTLIKELPQTQTKGLIIHILIETSPGCGLNTSGALSSSLACAINLFFEKIPLTELTSWSTMETTAKINKEMFDNVFRLAWKFECVPHADAATGATVFAPFIWGSYPVVFWSIPLHWNFDKETWQTHYGFVAKAQYFGMRIDELFDFADQPFWPIDLALIYSGESRATALTVISARENIEELAQIHHDLLITDKKLKNVDLLPNIYRLLKSSKSTTRLLDTFWDTLTNPIALNSLEILFGFKEIFERGLSQETLRSFFKHINRNQNLLSALGLSSPIVDSISQSFKNEIKNLGDDYGAATKITGGGIRGDILFTCAYHGFRDQIDRVINKIKKETGENIFLDYASWLDGIEDEGLRVEQTLSEKIYSDFISQGSLQIKKVSQAQSTSQLLSFDQFSKSKRKMDIILDTIQEEIYIKGEEILSHDLPSSKMAIKVLQILLTQIGKEVKNSQFPLSSYSQDRNEFQSKISLPLAKVIQKKLKKRLPIEVRGGLSEFTITLHQFPFEIYLIEKSF